MIEVTRYEAKSILLVYLLEQEKRPPIKLSWNPKLTYFSVYDIGDPNNIGSFYITDDFNLVIVNSTKNSAILNLTPRALSDSDIAKNLILESLSNKEMALAKAAEAKSTMELAKANPSSTPIQTKNKQIKIGRAHV